jgi:glycerol transport system ATP-binding protein
MSLGKLVQRGTPEDLFERPNSKYVGNFIGSPAMNFFKAEVVDGFAKIGDYTLASSADLKKLSDPYLEFGIRPEHIEVHQGTGENVVTADFFSHDDLGSTRILNCRFGTGVIKVKVARSFEVPNHGPINLKLPKSNLLAYREGLQVL